MKLFRRFVILSHRYLGIALSLLVVDVVRLRAS